MKRFAVCVVALALTVAASPAYAVTSGDQGAGSPPSYSGGPVPNSAIVVHCNSTLNGNGSGVMVINKNGIPVFTCGL